ncbi:MAG: LytR C-terminal domain-containing protein [Longimicrobiales bacterium]
MSTLRVALVFLVVLASGALVGSAVTQWQPTVTPADSVAPPMDFGTRVRVEVLNAGGRPDMARRAVDILRDRGFDVVYFGNAESFGQDTSRVLDRVGRVDAARAVADALGIETVESGRNENLYLDVTVRLGLDWEPASTVPGDGSGRGSGEASDSRAWWDPAAELLERLRRP